MMKLEQLEEIGDFFKLNLLFVQVFASIILLVIFTLLFILKMYNDQELLNKSWADIVDEDEGSPANDQPSQQEHQIKSPILINEEVDPNWKDPMFMTDEEIRELRETERVERESRPKLPSVADSKWAPKDSTAIGTLASKWATASSPPAKSPPRESPPKAIFSSSPPPPPATDSSTSNWSPKPSGSMASRWATAENDSRYNNNNNNNYNSRYSNNNFRNDRRDHRNGGFDNKENFTRENRLRDFYELNNVSAEQREPLDTWNTNDSSAKVCTTSANDNKPTSPVVSEAKIDRANDVSRKTDQVSPVVSKANVDSITLVTGPSWADDVSDNEDYDQDLFKSGSKSADPLASKNDGVDAEKPTPVAQQTTAEPAPAKKWGAESWAAFADENKKRNVDVDVKPITSGPTSDATSKETFVDKSTEQFGSESTQPEGCGAVASDKEVDVNSKPDVQASWGDVNQNTATAGKTADNNDWSAFASNNKAAVNSSFNEQNDWKPVNQDISYAKETTETNGWGAVSASTNVASINFKPTENQEPVQTNKSAEGNNWGAVNQESTSPAKKPISSEGSKWGPASWAKFADEENSRSSHLHTTNERRGSNSSHTSFKKEVNSPRFQNVKPVPASNNEFNNVNTWEQPPQKSSSPSISFANATEGWGSVPQATEITQKSSSPSISFANSTGTWGSVSQITPKSSSPSISFARSNNVQDTSSSASQPIQNSSANVQSSSNGTWGADAWSSFANANKENTTTTNPVPDNKPSQPLQVSISLAELTGAQKPKELFIRLSDLTKDEPAPNNPPITLKLSDFIVDDEPAPNQPITMKLSDFLH